MRLVTRGSEVAENLRVLRSYLASGDGTDAEFAKSLIQRGICFLVVRYRGEDFFAPEPLHRLRREYAQTPLFKHAGWRDERSTHRPHEGYTEAESITRTRLRRILRQVGRCPSAR